MPIATKTDLKCVELVPEGEGYRVHGPRCRAFRDACYGLDLALRDYDTQTQTWWVDSAAYEMLVHRLTRALPALPIVQRGTAEESALRELGLLSEIRPDEARKTLHLLPSAPAPVVVAARRALSLRAHPDHGGDVEEMQRLNAAGALLEAMRLPEPRFPGAQRCRYAQFHLLPTAPGHVVQAVGKVCLRLYPGDATAIERALTWIQQRP